MDISGVGCWNRGYDGIGCEIYYRHIRFKIQLVTGDSSDIEHHPFDPRPHPGNDEYLNCHRPAGKARYNPDRNSSIIHRPGYNRGPKGRYKRRGMGLRDN